MSAAPRNALSLGRLLVFVLPLGISACYGTSLYTLFNQTPNPEVAPVEVAKPESYPKPTPLPMISHTSRVESRQSVKRTKMRKESDHETAASPPKKDADIPELKLAPVGASAAEVTARQQAEQAVTEASKRLETIDRSKLIGPKAGDYDMVRSFIEGAQRALQEQDFLRAQGLAQKASLLATQLGSSATPPP